MYDIHVGDKFSKEEGGSAVLVVELFPLENKVKYEYESGATRTVDREEFLERFPIVR